jgi:hypothetical protein
MAYRLFVEHVLNTFWVFLMAMAWMSFSVKTPVWQLHLHVRQSGIAMPLAMQSLQVDERMSPRKVRIVVHEQAYCC